MLFQDLDQARDDAVESPYTVNVGFRMCNYALEISGFLEGARGREHGNETRNGRNIKARR